MLPKCQVPELLPYPTEHPEVFGTGIYVVPNFPKGTVTVLMFSRNYRSVRYRNYCHTDVAQVAGSGIDVSPNLPNRMVPVLMLYGADGREILSYRTYRSVRYRDWCPIELAEVSGTGIDDIPIPVRTQA